MGVLWISSFVLGVSMFTPISSFNLCIDFYDLVFPGQQLAVKTTVCYEMAFVAFQVLCHLADAKLPISRAARIQIRHGCVALIMAFIIVWERVIVGDVHHPNPAALPILLAVVTLTGAFDGICVGAVFGEAAVLGPASAHALVAGTAGVMPLLAVLRIIFKAALPATTEGLVLSVALYFAAAAGVLLAGLAVYSFVVMPAVAAAVCCTYTGGAKQFKDELGVLPLVPMLGAVDDDEGDQDDEETGGGNGAELKRHGTLAYSLALPSSMRGMPVIVKRVNTGMNPTLLRMGTMEGAVDNFALTETLQSRATAAGRMRANSIWTAATLRTRGTMDPSMTLGCGGLRKSIDTSNESFTTRYNTIADQFALESLFEESIAGSTASSTADSCDTGFTGSSRTRSFKSVRSVRFIEDDFVESGLVGYNANTNTNSSIASSDVGSPRTTATDTTASSHCSWKSPRADGTFGDASGYFSTSSKPQAGKQWRQAAAAAPKRKSAMKKAQQTEASDDTATLDQDANQQQQGADQQQQQQQSTQQPVVSPFGSLQQDDDERQRAVVDAAFEVAQRDKQQRAASPFAAAAPESQEQQRAASPFAAAAPEPQEQQRAASPFAAAAPESQEQQRAASPFAAAAPEPQVQQRAASPFAAAAPPPQRRAPSPFEVATRLQRLQQDNDDDGDSDGGDTFTTDDDDDGDDKRAPPDVIPLQASSLSRGASMAPASSVASSNHNPYCLWAVDSTPFETPAASEAAFAMDSGLSLAAKLKDADFDVFADAAETQLSKTFSDALNSQKLRPGFLRAATHAGVVQPVLEEMLLRAATMAPETPQFFGEGMNMWRSNWLTIRATKWYMLATILTYACNYGVFPAFVAYTMHSPALHTWYSLLLVTTYGVGDLAGKLLPIWKPRRPQATIMGIAMLRLLLFFMVFAVALLLKAPPPVFFVAVFLLALSGWYESMIFSLACEGHHPQDAYQIESLLAIQLDVGIALGSVLSLAWAAGPWAIGVTGTPGPHG